MTARRTTATKLADICEAQGFRVKRTRSGYAVYSKDGLTTVLFHCTPTDTRAYLNARADLRRIGVTV